MTWQWLAVFWLFIGGSFACGWYMCERAMSWPPHEARRARWFWIGVLTLGAPFALMLGWWIGLHL